MYVQLVFCLFLYFKISTALHLWYIKYITESIGANNACSTDSDRKTRQKQSKTTTMLFVTLPGPVPHRSFTAEPKTPLLPQKVGYDSIIQHNEIGLMKPPHTN